MSSVFASSHVHSSACLRSAMLAIGDQPFCMNSRTTQIMEHKVSSAPSETASTSQPSSSSIIMDERAAHQLQVRHSFPCAEVAAHVEFLRVCSQPETAGVVEQKPPDCSKPPLHARQADIGLAMPTKIMGAIIISIGCRQHMSAGPAGSHGAASA